MKHFYLVALIFILFICTGFSKESLIDISVSYQPNADRLESVFKAAIPIKEGIIFTKVPRGLIVSINEEYFFNNGESRIKESSLYILDIIVALLHKLSNYCVVENHTEENFNNDENRELSLSRSANIVQYMITCGKLPSSRLFALGYGQYMPFRDNVAPDMGINNRIDFVILEYEARR